MRTAILPLALVLALPLGGCGSHGPKPNPVVDFAICFPVPLALGGGTTELRATTCEPGVIDGELPDAKGTLTFSYDAGGLLSTAVWAPEKGAPETSSFTWDSSGLLTEEQLGPDLAVADLVRGTGGRLEGRTVTAGGAATPWTYTYDGTGSLDRVDEQRGPDHVRSAQLFWSGAQLDTRQVSLAGDVIEDWSYFWSSDGLDMVQSTIGRRTTTLELFRDADGYPHLIQTSADGKVLQQLELSRSGAEPDLVQVAGDDGNVQEELSLTYDPSGRVATIVVQQP